AGDAPRGLLGAGSALVEVRDLGGDRFGEAGDRGEGRLVEAGSGGSLRHREAGDRRDCVVRGAECDAHGGHSDGFILNTAVTLFECRRYVVGFIPCSSNFSCDTSRATGPCWPACWYSNSRPRSRRCTCPPSA